MRQPAQSLRMSLGSLRPLNTMPRKAFDWTNLRKGYLTVLERVGSAKAQALWRVRCDCGTEKIIPSSSLRGCIQSCGCQRWQAIGAAHTTHGKKHTRVYRIWNAMRQRCHNPNKPHFKRYG